MKHIFLWLALYMTTPCCLAESNSASIQQNIKKFLDNPGSFITPYGRPRTIAKGAKPEIYIHNDHILINGRSVKMGDQIDVWKQALPGTPRCLNFPEGTICAWDALGIEIITKSKINNSVDQITIYFNIQPRELWKYATTLPDGTPVEPPKDLRPKNPFRGYFAIDGYGIDAKTEFWEILAKANPERNLHCGARDCGFPLGALNDTDAIHFRLNKPTVRGNIYELSIAAPYEAPNTKSTDGNTKQKN